MRSPSKARKRSFVVLTFGGVFGYIAIWQFMTFGLLILMVWTNEVLDFGNLLLNLPRRDFDWMRGSLATGGLLLAAAITVWNTYLQQQQIVRGLLTICTYCHRIQADATLWQRLETYISKRSEILFSHGICPTCLETEKQKILREAAAAGFSGNGAAGCRDS